MSSAMRRGGGEDRAVGEMMRKHSIGVDIGGSYAEHFLFFA